MDETICLREFKELATRLSIELRYSNEGPSGLCTVKGKRVMFINRNLDKRSQLDVFVRDFKTLDLEGFFIVPIIRKLLGMEHEGSDW
jgi:hypothetical protein